MSMFNYTPKYKHIPSHDWIYKRRFTVTICKEPNSVARWCFDCCITKLYFLPLIYILSLEVELYNFQLKM